MSAVSELHHALTCTHMHDTRTQTNTRTRKHVVSSRMCVRASSPPLPRSSFPLPPTDSTLPSVLLPSLPPRPPLLPSLLPNGLGCDTVSATDSLQHKQRTLLAFSVQNGERGLGGEGNTAPDVNHIRQPLRPGDPPRSIAVNTRRSQT